MMRIRIPLAVFTVAVLTVGCSGADYPSDDCVSDTRIAQARQAKDDLLKVIPRERVIEVNFEDGCNDSEEPSAVAFLKGRSNPLVALDKADGWQPVTSQFLTSEKASAGVVRPLDSGSWYLVAVWGPTPDDELEKKPQEESSLSLTVEGFSPAVTAGP